jgi:hypothetical protein
MARALMRRAVVANAALFQLAWFGFVVGAATGNAGWGLAPLVVLAALSWHNGHWRSDLPLVVIAAGIGAYLERLWIEFGVFSYPDAAVPWWIVALWISVALTLNHSLSWFGARPWLGASMAALAAPLSYLAGEHFGAVAIGDGLALVSLAWGAVFFVLFALIRSQRLNFEEFTL